MVLIALAGLFVASFGQQKFYKSKLFLSDLSEVSIDEEENKGFDPNLTFTNSEVKNFTFANFKISYNEFSDFYSKSKIYLFSYQRAPPSYNQFS